MKILIVCPYFPPENAIASVRIGKFAQHWAEDGHTVTVLCRNPVSEGVRVVEHQNLQVIPVRDPLESVWKKSVEMSGPAGSGRRDNLLRRVKAVFKRSFWPDVFGPWSAQAFRHARRLEMSPDVVIASVGPFSGLLLGSALARRFRAPLVLDYRDLLSFGTYYEHGRFRRRIDNVVERVIASRAALTAAVSRPMVEELESLYKRPSIVVANGYEPDDFVNLEYAPTSTTTRIVYCGQIYAGRRDPAPLFHALRLLRSSGHPCDISVEFYGRNLAGVIASAAKYGVDDLVAYKGEVTHGQSLELQAGADLLLLLLWDDPRERGVLSGKLFEYIGARRPIMMLGLEDGAAADVVRSAGLGFVSNDPQTLADSLRALSEEKEATGRIAAPQPPDPEAFTRRTQSKSFLRAIEGVVGSSGL